MTSYRIKLTTAVFACALLALATAVAAQEAYTVQGFGTPGIGTYPQHINDAGDVAGYHYPNGYQRAFVYRAGVFTDIGTFGGSHSWVGDINGSGIVVGSAYTTNNQYYRAFLYDGTLRDIGGAANTYSQAHAINASGQVVGYSNNGAFFYANGVTHTLHSLLPANSGWQHLYDATDINDAGQVVGRGYHASLGYRGFLFTPATGSSPATIVAIGNMDLQPQWINSSGQVAGITNSGLQQAFLYTPSTGSLMTFGLGGTYTYPYDLNDSGQVVGLSYVTNNTVHHPFIFSNGQITDLDPGGTSYGYATGINNSGAVVGYRNVPFIYTNGAMRTIDNLVNGCNWSFYSQPVVNNVGQVAGAGYEPNVGGRALLLTPVVGQLQTVVTASNASAPYRGSVQLQARATYGCSSLQGKSIAFSLPGASVGSAATGDDGWARLQVQMPSHITAGTYVDGIEATFDGDSTFDAASDKANLTVFRANPVLTWTPEAVIEGTPLGPDQLNATADVAGTFSYSPGAGTVPAAGLRRLNVSFTPADTANYNSRSAQALLAVRASSPAFVFSASEVAGLGGTNGSDLRALNNAGQAVGHSWLPGNPAYRAILFANGTTTDLGGLGGQLSQANDINDAGHVTGWAQTTNNTYQRAFLYNGSVMTDLGALISTNNHSEGRAINAAGDVALYARSSTGYYHAFVYTAATGVMTDLGALSGGYNESYPTDINSSRQVVGHSYPSYDCYHAFLATASGMHDLGTLGGRCSQALAINDAGDVVGWAHDSADQQRAFLYKNGTMTDLGTLGGSYAYAQAINEDGVITGYSYTANNAQLRAFKYANGVMTDLGVITGHSQGRDINDGGHVVGSSNSADGTQTGMLHASGVMHDLNALINVGETAGINEARFINNSGQILGRDFYTSPNRWYLLTPTTLASSSLSLTAAAAVYQGTTTLTAVLSIPDPEGASVQFRLNGQNVGTAIANAGGVAVLQNVTLGTLNAGTHTAAASASFNGTAEYAGSTAAADVVIAKATPSITWANPAAIVYGTPLSSTQLNATSGIAGQFTFTPGTGTVLPAGTHTLHVSFVPANSTNYNNAEADVTITVTKKSPVLTWSNPANLTYGTALSGTQLNATASVAGTFTYTPAAGTVLNAGNGQTLSVSFVPTDTANYNSATRSVIINVLKATPTVTWSNPADIVYGTALGATQLNASTPIDGTFAYSPSAGTQLNAGTHTLSATFTPADAANYNSSAKNVSIRVLKATPAISWNTPAPIEYGTLLSGTQLNATSATAGSFSYTPAAGTKLNAGAAQTLSVSFTPADSANYNAASASVTINVSRATPTLTWVSPADITYGTALSGTQLNATASTDGAFTYTPAAGTTLNAGSGQTLSVSFTPANAQNYNGASATVTINVLKATPDITWNAPADIVFGTALSGTQLNATGSVPGTFTYSPAAGTTLNAGNGQTLSVSFTPADAQNYNAASASVTINVSKKTPTVTWNSPADIVFGTPLSGTQLNATGSVPGTFTYSPAAGTTLGANVHTLSVDFVPSDGANYNPVSGTTVLLNVLKATPSIAWNNPAPIVYGTALGGAQLNATTSVNGVFTYSPAPGAILGAGLGQVLTVSFTPTDQANYNGANASVAIDVAKAPSFTVVTGGTYLFDNQVHPAAGSVYGANGIGLGAPAIVYTPAPAPAVAPLAPGIYTVQATFAGDANHLPSAAAATITINAPPKIVSVTGPLSPQPVGTTATITAAFDDAATNDPHTCVFGWNDGTSTQIVASSAETSCSASHSFTTPGVYPVEVRVIDDEGYTAIEEFKYVVVFDPDGAFVTGGGWIVSPAGAYQADPSLTGKAHFGFVSKYRPGAAVPTGNTEFEFQVANFRFKSTAYDWLVVAGSRAQYQGTGTINGAGAYAFKLTGIDGQVTNGGGIDKFRIRIWDRVTGVVIYDNRLSEDETTGDPQEIGGGSIVIHTR